MKSSNIPVTDDGRPYLKMKAVREGTDCPASTIQYYQNLGLLHDTIKTGTNMAYYHPDTIERVHYIRLLQSRYRLPISRIKELVDNNTMDDKVKVVSYLNDIIFGPESDNLITLQQFSELTGLDEAVIGRLVAMGLLVPVQDDLFDSQDIMIGVIMKKCMTYNLTAEDIEFYAESARALVENEMAIRERLSANLSLEDNSAITQELTQMARTYRTYIFDRTFQKKILNSLEIKDK